MNIELTPEQSSVVLGVLEDINVGKPLVTFSGVAGTGKTTSAVHIIGELLDSYNVAVCTVVGRASKVIGEKLLNEGIIPDYCGTIHGLIYKPNLDKDGNVRSWSRRGELPYNIIFIDELSMVTFDMMQDLMKFGVPIIGCGDHGQLPAISKNPTNYAENTDYMLTKILRQSLDSGIIRASMDIRNNGFFDLTDDYGGDVVLLSRYDSDCIIDEFMPVVDENKMMLCSYNNTRQKLNHRIRTNQGRLTPEPEVGERIICLKNSKEYGIFNGDLGVVEKIIDNGKSSVVGELQTDFGGLNNSNKYRHFKQAYYDSTEDQKKYNDWKFLKRYQDKKKSVPLPLWCDFANAITIWKAQGSQYEETLIIDEPVHFLSPQDNIRLRYTAITRAEKKAIVLI